MLNSSSSITQNLTLLTSPTYFNTENKNESHYSVSIYRCNEDHL